MWHALVSGTIELAIFAYVAVAGNATVVGVPAVEWTRTSVGYSGAPGADVILAVSAVRADSEGIRRLWVSAGPRFEQADVRLRTNQSRNGRDRPNRIAGDRLGGS